MHRNKSKFAHLALLVLCTLVGTFVVTVGCSIVGGSGGLQHADNYAVKAPTGWKRTSKKDSDYAYTLPSGSIVTVVSSCDHRSQAPLEVLSNHLLIGSRNRQIHKRGLESIGAAKGSWTEATVHFEEVPIGLALFVTKAEGCVFDFSLMKREQLPAEDVKMFREFIATFEYGKD